MSNWKEKLKFYTKDMCIITMLICGVFSALTLVSFIAYFIIKAFN